MMWRRAVPAAALLALAATAALAQPVGPAGGWGDRPWMMMHGGWGWGGLVWLIALVALVSLAVVLLRRRAPGAASGPAGAAAEALDLRYARGELERDEYLHRKADILGRG